MLSKSLQPLTNQYHLCQLQFSSIDARSRHIQIINLINTKFIFISKLYLDNNLLKSLQGIQQFRNLQLLRFNFNYVDHKEQLCKIRNCFMIKDLGFLGNPIQTKVDLTWLQSKGFTKLIAFNQVNSIGQHLQHQITYDQNAYQPQSTKRNHNSDKINIKNQSMGYLIKSRQSDRDQVGKIYNRQAKKSTKFNKTINKSENIFESNKKSIRSGDNVETKRQTHAAILIKDKKPLSQTIKPYQKTINRLIKEQNSTGLPMSSSHHLSTKPPNHSQYHLVKPFKLHPFQQTKQTNQQQEQVYLPSTGRFNKEVKSLFKQEIQEPFIDQYKKVISTAYYFRTLMEKAFNTLRDVVHYQANLSSSKSVAQVDHQSIIKQIDNQSRVKSLKWAWLKLKVNDSVAKTLQNYKSWQFIQYNESRHMLDSIRQLRSLQSSFT